jgi:spermidine/putrescine transport system substrate-binding protein
MAVAALQAAGRTMALLATLLAFPSCDRPSVGAAPAPDPSAAPASIPPRTRLVLFVMEDFIDPAILAQFERETGIGVDPVLYDDPDEVSPRLRSKPGCADLVIVDSFSINSLRELRLLRPLRKDTLANYANIDPKHQHLACDPKGDFSIPYHWGTTLVAYRRDLVPEPGRSWRLLWDPSLKGRVMMLDDSYEPMALAMILNNIDLRTADESAYGLAADFMLDHLNAMQPRYATDDEVKDALVAGTVSAAMCYSGDAAVAAEENPNIDFFIPDEGATIWVDCLAICRDSQHPELAHRFLDFFLRPEIAAQNAKTINYPPANLAAEALIPPSLKNDPRLYPPPDFRSRLHHVPALDETHETLSRRHWHRLRNHVVAMRRPESASHQDRPTSP